MRKWKRLGGQYHEILWRFASESRVASKVASAGESVSNAYFEDHATVWGTPGQLAGGTVWVQVGEILDAPRPLHLLT